MEPGTRRARVHSHALDGHALPDHPAELISRNERNVLAKQRVYELAKELGLTNKECIDLCNALGYGVKSHSSSLDGA